MKAIVKQTGGNQSAVSFGPYLVSMTATGGTEQNGAPFNPNWECRKWRVRLAYNGRKIGVTFYTGLGITSAPHAADVLDCLLSDASMSEEADSFGEWATNLGYDPDSRKAYSIWRSCQRQTERVKAWLADDYDSIMNTWPRDWEEDKTD